MEILKDYNLSKLNTFGINAKAKFLVEIASEGDLAELFNLPEFLNNQKIFLGGGSNVLFTKDFDGIVVLNKLKGIEILRKNSSNDENVYVKSMGGELWQNFVEFVVDQGFWGIENLALVPGTVGAAPIQNIGAYGVEVKDALESVEVFEITTGTKKVLSNKECELGYRDSVFKNKLKGKYFISAITLKLSRKPARQLVGGEKKIYPALRDYLEKNKIKINGPKDISDAVTFIRKNKLPDPKIVGNAGSFFKNVFVSKKQLSNLLKIYPNMPYFEEDKVIKIPAGWLIEQCGWKGRRMGNVGVHEKQALVLVNYGGATGGEIVELANKIIKSVREKFSLELIPEVNIV